MLVQSRILYQALQYHFLLLALISNFLPIDTESTIVNQYIVSTYFMPLLLCMNSRCSLLKSTSPHRPNVRARKNEQSEDPSSPLPRLLRCWRFSKHSWRCVQLDFQVPNETMSGGSRSFQQNYRIQVQLSYHSLASECESDEPWQCIWVTMFISSYTACGWKKMRCVWWSLWVVL